MIDLSILLSHMKSVVNGAVLSNEDRLQFRAEQQASTISFCGMKPIVRYFVMV